MSCGTLPGGVMSRAATTEAGPWLIAGLSLLAMSVLIAMDITGVWDIGRSGSDAASWATVAGVALGRLAAGGHAIALAASIAILSGRCIRMGWAVLYLVSATTIAVGLWLILALVVLRVPRADGLAPTLAITLLTAHAVVLLIPFQSGSAQGVSRTMAIAMSLAAAGIALGAALAQRHDAAATTAASRAAHTLAAAAAEAAEMAQRSDAAVGAPLCAALAEVQRAQGLKQMNGILYEERRKGAGPMPWLDSTVVFHHRRMDMAGHVFEDTYAVNQPKRHLVGEMGADLQSALLLMRAGARWRVVALSPSASGPQAGSDGRRSANLVVHEIELLEIQPPRR